MRYPIVKNPNFGCSRRANGSEFGGRVCKGFTKRERRLGCSERARGNETSNRTGAGQGTIFACGILAGALSSEHLYRDAFLEVD